MSRIETRDTLDAIDWAIDLTDQIEFATDFEDLMGRIDPAISYGFNQTSRAD